jgi:hypothetical protein
VFVILLSGIFFFISCINNEKLIDTTEKIRFSFPDSLIAYRPFKIEKTIPSNYLEKADVRLITYIDVSCPSCLSTIENWKIVENKLSPYKIPVLLICQSEDKFEMFKFLCETKKIQNLILPFYLDKTKQFFKKNPFLNHKPNQHTVLIDKNDNILIDGDLTLDKTTEKNYIRTINIQQHKP